MQLRRAMEIINGTQENKGNQVVYFNDQPVNLISVDNNIGTAYVQSTYGNMRTEVDLNQIHEKR